MKKHIGMLVLAVSVGGILLLNTVTYTVDELQDVILIKTFGKITAVRQGEKHAGLNFKWPWPIQKLVRYDRRTMVFEDTSLQVDTNDGRNMLVTLYCAWRIDDAAKFHRNVVEPEDAEKRLRGLLQSNKGEVVGSHVMGDFVNTDPQAMKIAQIEREIFEGVQDAVQRSEYGIEVVRVGLKSLALPERVTGAVIDSMKEERQEKVHDLKSQGEAMATAIIARAKSASAKILTFANHEAADIRTEGDRAAAEWYGKYGENYKLSMFLRALESLKKQLKDRSVILLDGSVLPHLKWLGKSPSLSDLPGRDAPPKPAGPPGRGAPTTRPAADIPRDRAPGR